MACCRLHRAAGPLPGLEPGPPAPEAKERSSSTTTGWMVATGKPAERGPVSGPTPLPGRHDRLGLPPGIEPGVPERSIAPPRRSHPRYGVGGRKTAGAMRESNPRGAKGSNAPTRRPPRPRGRKARRETGGEGRSRRVFRSISPPRRRVRHDGCDGKRSSPRVSRGVTPLPSPMGASGFEPLSSGSAPRRPFLAGPCARDRQGDRTPGSSHEGGALSNAAGTGRGRDSNSRLGRHRTEGSPATPPRPRSRRPADGRAMERPGVEPGPPALRAGALPLSYRSAMLPEGIEPSASASKVRHPSPAGTPGAQRPRGETTPTPGRGLEPRTTRVTAEFPHQAGPPDRSAGTAPPTIGDARDGIRTHDRGVLTRTTTLDRRAFRR